MTSSKLHYFPLRLLSEFWELEDFIASLLWGTQFNA